MKIDLSEVRGIDETNYWKNRQWDEHKKDVRKFYNDLTGKILVDDYTPDERMSFYHFALKQGLSALKLEMKWYSPIENQ